LLAQVLALIGLAVGSGCRTLPALPPADLQAPGWTVRHGQAVWKPNGARPELAGELLLATHGNGDCLVSFTKTPFPIASARQAGEQWQVEFGPGDYTVQGQGEGPRSFSWFVLPRALAGEELSRGWRFARTNGSWRLENWRSGERLEGTFAP
jgi:hypothetical protein